MEKIIVIGGGGHAKVVISILKKIKKYNVVGYVDREDKGKVLGAPYLGTDLDLIPFQKKNKTCSAAIGVGNVTLEHNRRGMLGNLKKIGFKLPAIVSPDAIVSEDAQLGEATVVMDGAVINAGAKVGKAAIINTRSSVDHDCTIGDFVHIAPGVTLCGEVSVGEGSLIGAGSTVIQQKKIGVNCLIGAASVVVDDCIESGIYTGVPAQRKTSP